MLWRCCTQCSSKFGKTQQWPQDWKRTVFIPIPKKGNAKGFSNYLQLCSFDTLAKLCQNPSSQTSAVHEPWTSRWTSWVSKRQKNQGSNCQHPVDHRKSKRVPEKHTRSLLLKISVGRRITWEAYQTCKILGSTLDLNHVWGLGICLFMNQPGDCIAHQSLKTYKIWKFVWNIGNKNM